MSKIQMSTVPGLAGVGARAARSSTTLPRPASRNWRRRADAPRRTSSSASAKAPEILAIEPGLVAGEIIQPLRRNGQAKLAHQPGVRFDPAIGVGQKRARRRRVEQRAHRPRRPEHPLRLTHSTGGKDREDSRDGDPQGSDDDDRRRGLRPDHHPLLPPSIMRPS